MVDRIPSGGIPYRTIKNGIFVGNQEKLIFFPLPEEKKLVEKYYQLVALSHNVNCYKPT